MNLSNDDIRRIKDAIWVLDMYELDIRDFLRCAWGEDYSLTYEQ